MVFKQIKVKLFRRTRRVYEFQVAEPAAVVTAPTVEIHLCQPESSGSPWNGGYTTRFLRVCRCAVPAVPRRDLLGMSDVCAQCDKWIPPAGTSPGCDQEGKVVL